MQTLNIKSILLSLLFLFTISACEKDRTMKDEENPEIVILTPRINDMFMDGDTVHIHAELTDNDELHEISAKIMHTHMGLSQEVWRVDTHSHKANYIFDEDFIIEVDGMHNDFKLEFTVSDHNGNIGTKEFIFHVM